MYKRQSIDSTHYGAFTKYLPVLHVLDKLIKHTAFHLHLRKRKIIRRIVSVSYTHLDVYKRQSYNFLLIILMGLLSIKTRQSKILR